MRFAFASRARPASIATLHRTCQEDPVPGEKRGKGIQHLTSSYWIYDMGVFVQRNFPQMQLMARSDGGAHDARSIVQWEFPGNSTHRVSLGFVFCVR